MTMNRMLIVSALSLVAMGLMPLHAAGGPKAGFDCAKAGSDLEKAICADPLTAEGDYAMSVAFKALMANPTPPAFIEALRADQRDFLAIRLQAWQVKGNRQMASERLRDGTDLRAEFLNWINPEPPAGLVGNWANAWGMIRISQAADGSLKMDSNVVDQVAGTWLCGFNGPLNATTDAQAVGHTVAGDLVVRRNGPLLEVPEPFCDETGPAINGSMQGVYFRVGAEE